jgi:AcrR family transcriptional regulator
VTAPLPRGRHKLSREEVVRAQRTRILAAMADAMAEHGYASTPVAEILKRAGVSRETFYEQFSSKQDCFLAALDTTVAVLVEDLTSALKTEGTTLERFDRLVGRYLDALGAEPAAARLFLIESYAAGPEVLARRTQLHRQLIDGLAELIGARTESDRFACEVLISAIIAMVTVRIGVGDIAGLPALRGPLVDLMRRALG